MAIDIIARAMASGSGGGGGTEYIAGDNIDITGNVISAIDTIYEAGENISIENDVISATDTTYTAGDNITIEDNVISATQYQLPYASNSVKGGVRVNYDSENNALYIYTEDNE